MNSKKNIIATTIISANALLVAILLLLNGLSYDTISYAIRLTSKVSLVLFTLIFIASPLHNIWPSTFSRWLKLNRRQFGIGFGITLLVSHIGLMLWMYGIDSQRIFDRIKITDIYGGGFGLIILFIMVVTSFKRFSSAISSRVWKKTHTLGLYVIFIIFVFDQIEKYFFTPSPPHGAWFYIPFIIMLFAALGIRIWSFYRES